MLPSIVTAPGPLSSTLAPPMPAWIESGSANDEPINVSLPAFAQDRHAAGHRDLAGVDLDRVGAAAVALGGTLGTVKLLSKYAASSATVT